MTFFVLPVAVLMAAAPGQPIGKEEQEVVNLVNAERKKVGRAPLTVNYSLQESAWAHNSLMTSTGCFSHQCPGEKRYDQRIAATGYKAMTSGENIAQGQRTPASVMTAWMNSSGHKANILNANYTDIGVAYDPKGPTWTQNFAAPVKGVPTVTPPSGGNGGGGPKTCVLPMDFDADQEVTSADVDAIARRFMRTSEAPGWDARYDVVKDGVIDVRDIFEVMLAVGTKC